MSTFQWVWVSVLLLAVYLVSLRGQNEQLRQVAEWATRGKQ